MSGASFYVGLMSGTSLDGIDAVLMEFSDEDSRCIGTLYRPYPEDLRTEILALSTPGQPNELHRTAALSNRLADAYAETVLELLDRTKVSAKSVGAIGCHGQTIRHAPADGYTLQINNPARLVEKTGIAVVADFRSRDIAAGGQGAPLVPAFHQARFASPDRHRIILNVGGIANLTDLKPGHPVRGFDCGPGNLLLDAWIRRHQGHPYDEGGRWGASGRVIGPLLAGMEAHPFLAAPPPKSCGREEFNPEWLDRQLKGDEAAEDVQATLLAFTAGAIAHAIGRWCGKPGELFLCGGGAHNEALMRALSAAMGKGTRVDTTAALGLPPDWVEGAAFAWLAKQTAMGLPGNLPEVTGACGPRILGAIYPA